MSEQCLPVCCLPAVAGGALLLGRPIHFAQSQCRSLYPNVLQTDVLVEDRLHLDSKRTIAVKRAWMSVPLPNLKFA